jgi:hypothetical protein
MAQLNDAADDETLTVEQCINDNTDTPLKRVEEKALIEAGIIDENLGNRLLTKEVCGDIIARTKDRSPMERIIMTANVIQELDIIQRRMKKAVEGDVNGDGAVSAQDSRVVSASSYAASHAAQQTVRMAINEDANDTGMIQNIKVETAAYQQYQDDGGGDGGAAGGGAGGGGDSSATLPSYETVQDKAKDAAETEGAISKAAAAGGTCATEVALTNATMKLVKANMVFEEPTKKMQWKSRDVLELVMSPSTLDSIDELKQTLEDAEKSDEIHGQCIGLAEKMKAEFVDSKSAFAITSYTGDVQDIAFNSATEWEWGIVANKEGTHHVALNIEWRWLGGDISRSITPLPFDDEIMVSATLWQKTGTFVGNNWQYFLAPFLAPIAFYLWRRYKQPSNEHQGDEYT